MRKLIMTASLCAAFAITMSMRSPMTISRTYDANGPVLWADSIHTDDNTDGPKLFSVIMDAQKFLTDRKIGINVFGDRYELLYKRIY